MESENINVNKMNSYLHCKPEINDTGDNGKTEITRIEKKDKHSSVCDLQHHQHKMMIAD